MTRQTQHLRAYCTILLRSVFALLLPALLWGCAEANKATEKPTLVVSIEPLRYFVEAIAGEHYGVVTLVPPGSSPEAYDPTPDKLISMNEAAGYIRLGMMPFEQTWLKRMAEAVPHLRTLDAAEGVAYLDTPCDHSHGDEPHEHAYDLHVWTSTQNGRIIAQNVTAFMQKIDTAHAAYYQQRCDSLLVHIDSLDAAIRQELKYVKHRTFGIYHPALAYYAKDYGLRQLAVEDGGREPSVARMAELVNACRRDSVRLIFVQKEFPMSKVTSLAKEVGARTMVINPLSAAWDEEMLDIARKLSHE